MTFHTSKNSQANFTEGSASQYPLHEWTGYTVVGQRINILVLMGQRG